MKKKFPKRSPAQNAELSPDFGFMEMAFAAARRVKGKTLPNPPVGAVLVKHGKVIGRGGTRAAGQAHAEIVALAQAQRGRAGRDGSAFIKGATLYVTLEPCSHFGRTPPCTQALIAAGISRVVAACPDPNPKVAGRGFAALRRAGIKVDVAPQNSIWRETAEEFYGGFFFWIRHGRPRIVVKIAQSLDGRINASAGEETSLTGPEARRFAHGLRSRADAILVGAETVRVDNPDLTPRLTGGPSPEVLVLTRRSRLDFGLKVFARPRVPKTRILGLKTPKNLPDWVEFTPLALPTPSLTLPTRTSARMSAKEAAARTRDAKALARSLLAVFAERGFHEVLVEGGRGVWTPFLEAGLCDILHVVTAPVLLPAGESWAKELGPGWVKPLEFHRFTPLGRDSLTTFRRRVSAR